MVDSKSPGTISKKSCDQRLSFFSQSQLFLWKSCLDSRVDWGGPVLAFKPATGGVPPLKAVALTQELILSLRRPHRALCRCSDGVTLG